MEAYNRVVAKYRPLTTILLCALYLSDMNLAYKRGQNMNQLSPLTTRCSMTSRSIGVSNSVASCRSAAVT